MVKKALKICFQAHEHQLDKDGNPYVFHRYEVAMHLEDESEVCAALLKDILEDRIMTDHDLRDLGFSASVIEALQALKRPKSMSYETYLRRVKQNELATRVLIQDIRYDLLQSVGAGMNHCMQKKSEKYEKALLFLNGYAYAGMPDQAIPVAA